MKRLVKRTITDNLQELFVVVDKNDTIREYRTRFDCHRDKRLIHRSVGVVVYDDRGRVLLQKRSRTKDLQPGLWGISAAGHVTKGESYEDSIHRELAEELGVALLLTFHRTSLFEDDREREMQAIYLARSNGPFAFNRTEIEEIQFVGKKELQDKIKNGTMRLTTWAVASLRAVAFLPA